MLYNQEGIIKDTSNIASVKIFSSMALNPRAPVFLAIPFFAINFRALSVKCNLTCKNIALAKIDYTSST